MITRKAAVGFILLALLVFPVAYFSWQPPMPKIKASDVDLGDYKYEDRSIHETELYRTADVSYGSPVELAIVITGVIEAFAFICYLALKKIEPFVVAWEQSERARIRNS
jgi:hypothetical protein